MYITLTKVLLLLNFTTDRCFDASPSLLQTKRVDPFLLSTISFIVMLQGDTVQHRCVEVLNLNILPLPFKACHSVEVLEERMVKI